jgi:hypothetical protein
MGEPRSLRLVRAEAMFAPFVASRRAGSDHGVVRACARTIPNLSRYGKGNCHLRNENKPRFSLIFAPAAPSSCLPTTCDGRGSPIRAKIRAKSRPGEARRGEKRVLRFRPGAPNGNRKNGTGSFSVETASGMGSVSVSGPSRRLPSLSIAAPIPKLHAVRAGNRPEIIEGFGIGESQRRQRRKDGRLLGRFASFAPSSYESTTCDGRKTAVLRPGLRPTYPTGRRLHSSRPPQLNVAPVILRFSDNHRSGSVHPLDVASGPADGCLAIHGCLAILAGWLWFSSSA